MFSTGWFQSKFRFFFNIREPQRDFSQLQFRAKLMTWNEDIRIKESGMDRRGRFKGDTKHLEGEKDQ